MYIDSDDVWKALNKRIDDRIKSIPIKTPEDKAYCDALFYVSEHLDDWIHDAPLPNWPLKILITILLSPLYILMAPVLYVQYRYNRARW